VLEAMSEGVLFTSLEHSAAADALAVLRPQLSAVERAAAFVRAFGYAGRPCDYGHRDVRGRKPGRGHLIEQRLKEMMVWLIDDRDVDLVMAGQCLRRVETAEAASDHDHPSLSGPDDDNRIEAASLTAAPSTRLAMARASRAALAPPGRRDHFRPRRRGFA
jgi:hypothetical protein